MRRAGSAAGPPRLREPAPRRPRAAEDGHGALRAGPSALSQCPVTPSQSPVSPQLPSASPQLPSASPPSPSVSPQLAPVALSQLPAPKTPALSPQKPSPRSLLRCHRQVTHGGPAPKSSEDPQAFPPSRPTSPLAGLAEMHSVNK